MMQYCALHVMPCIIYSVCCADHDVMRGANSAVVLVVTSILCLCRVCYISICYADYDVLRLMLEWAEWADYAVLLWGVL